MSAEANKAAVLHWVESGWNQGNLDLADEMYAPSYMIHDPVAPDFPGGIEAFKAYVRTLRTGLPDIHFTVNEMVTEGERVVWRFTALATHLGELLGIPPTGKRATVTGIVISRFEDGLWAEDYVNWDTFGMLVQLGVIPAPGQASAVTA
jgi:steroid delta-isomerase-like uncharacterized protein